jgi:predicted permease
MAMRWLRFLRRGRRDADFARELEAHLAHEVDDLVEGGMAPEEARFAARRRLGNLTRLKEDIHERNSLVRLEGLWRDVSFGARQLRRSPGFALVAVLSLALGIGANTAIFSLLHQVLLGALPVPNPEELVYLYHPGPVMGRSSTNESGGPSFSYPVFRELRARQTSFTGLAGARDMPAHLAYGGRTWPGRAHRVSGNYFAVLGVRAALGRVLEEDDDRPSAPRPVVVLSHRTWRTRFGEDPAVLNQTLRVNGHPMTIVGVAQKGFENEYRRGRADVFVPIGLTRELGAEEDSLDSRENHWVTLPARLRPGVSRAEAEAATNAVYRGQLEADIEGSGRRDPDFLERYRAKQLRLEQSPAGRGGLGGETRTGLPLLLGITLLVLLICCVNVANLLLARGASRARELSARLALGASRLRLVRQLLVEAALLALAGAALGLPVARATLGILLSAAPQTRLSAQLDGRVLLYCLAIAAASVAVFGLAPALRVSRLDLATALKSQSPQIGGARAGRAIGRSLVTGQLAVSLLLLVCAGLLSKTFVKLARADLGLRVDHLVTFALEPKLSRYGDDEAAALYDRLRERLAALPGVTLASFARLPAVGHWTASSDITVTGFTAPDDEATYSSYNEVGPDYFRTLGMPLVMGRELSEADGAGTPKVAVVNQTFVRHFLAGRHPLGQKIGWGVGDDVVPDIEIVGVVRDAKYSSIRESPPRVFYTAARQRPGSLGVHFYLRTGAPPEALLRGVEKEVARAAPQLPIRDLKTMRQQLDEDLGGERMLSTLTGAFGALATLLASIGLYGVLAYDVARRSREIGIRVALGADARQVRRLVLRDVVRMLAVGSAFGLAASVGVGRFVQSLLYEMQPWDPVVYAFALATLALVALTAASLPARRATRVDPMSALRHE